MIRKKKIIAGNLFLMQVVLWYWRAIPLLEMMFWEAKLVIYFLTPEVLMFSWEMQQSLSTGNCLISSDWPDLVFVVTNTWVVIDHGDLQRSFLNVSMIFCHPILFKGIYNIPSMDASLSLSHVCFPLTFHVTCFHRLIEWFWLEKTFKKYLTKSPCDEQGHLQNHRIIEWIKVEGTKMGLCGPPSCWSRFMLDYTDQHCIQRVLEYLQGSRF